MLCNLFISIISGDYNKFPSNIEVYKMSVVEYHSLKRAYLQRVSIIIDKILL